MTEVTTAQKGLQGVVVGNSVLSLVDGENGRLIYGGYKIEDLAENALYEEVVYLLFHGRLPNGAELQEFTAHLAKEAVVPAQIIDFMQTQPKDTNGMAMLRTTTSMLAHYDPEAEDMNIDAVRRRSFRLIGQLTTLCAAWIRISQGKDAIAPKPNFNLAENFVYMITGDENLDRAAVDAINVYQVLLAEHGMNASTFTARVVTATGADLYSAIVAAIGALKGPSHGGANSEAMKMFLEIGDPGQVDAWFTENIKSGKRRIMGIGHRIYKALDPRANILKAKAQALAQSSGNGTWFELAAKLDDTARADDYFIERKLYANVDYYSAIVLYTLNIDIDMFTPLFAMSRVAGWTAHVIEQLGDNRLIRPDVNYVGPMDLQWTSADQR
ncbi:MAG: citrate/2-methylcitrate synthase [Anaerolineae bacterium]|jgi:citrate synthase|nr:citrate/2-methylcitrate synthase [Anaerolineae bacterium]